MMKPNRILMMTNNPYRPMSLRGSYSPTDGKLLGIVRGELAVSPLQTYNPVNIPTIGQNKAVTHPFKTSPTTVTFTVDFKNKIAGSDKENPNVTRFSQYSSTLRAPNGTWSSETDLAYSRTNNQDGTCFSVQSIGNNEIPQYLISFNLIRDYEDKYGAIPANDTAGKVEWLKNNGNALTFKPYVYGSCPVGNKANVAVWDGSKWYSSYNNSTNSPSLVPISIAKGYIPTYIMNDGFIHFLAYTDASDGVTPSTIYTDYVSLDITVNQPEQTALDEFVYVGGDTDGYTFDFGTKVANSVAECPLKIYRSFSGTIQTPTGTWAETTVQADIDKTKTQDDAPYTISSLTVGNYVMLMAEVDLTAIANRYGSNSAMKSKLISIQVDAWAKGIGANAGVQTYGVVSRLYYNIGQAWLGDGTGGTYSSTKGVGWNDSTSSTISKISVTRDVSANGVVLDTNKVYILIASQYASDGTIASSVSLDYIKITCKFARIPDVVAPKPVMVPQKWMALMRFSPNWDSVSVPVNKVFASINKDINNRVNFELDASTDKLLIRSVYSGNTNLLYTNAQTIGKSQIVSLLVKYFNGMFFIKTLKNNGATESYSAPLSCVLGLCQLILGMNISNVTQSDSLFDYFTFKPLYQDLTDAQAELLLRGLPMPSKDNMVVNGDFSQGSTGWTTSGGTGTVTFNDKLVITVTDGINYKGSSQMINVLPNSKYDFSCGENTGMVYIIEYQGTTMVTGNAVNFDKTTGTKVYTSKSNVDNVKIVCSSGTNGNGTFTFDNISLTYQGSAPPILDYVMPNLIPPFSDSRWTLHANAKVQADGSLRLDATAGYQYSIVTIPVLPNNKYILTLNISAPGGYAGINEFYNAVHIGTEMDTNTTATGNVTKEFITQANTNKITLLLLNNASTGTFTFKDISLKLKM